MSRRQKLKNDIKKVRSEYNIVELVGVQLSAADLDTLILYIDNYCRYGYDKFNGLVEPMGDIKKVLDAYGIK